MPTKEPKPPIEPTKAVAHEPDWVKIDALTDADIAAQIAANPDAAPELTEEWFEKADKLEPIDVKAIRTRLDMSQGEFARTFRLNVAALRDWEQRRRLPRGPALALFRIIDREPAAARRALAPAVGKTAAEAFAAGPALGRQKQRKVRVPKTAK